MQISSLLQKRKIYLGRPLKTDSSLDLPPLDFAKVKGHHAVGQRLLVEVFRVPADVR